MNLTLRTVGYGVRRAVLGTGVLCALAATAAAQVVINERPAARNTITGSVQFDRKGPPPERLLVTLTPAAGGGGKIEAWTDLAGLFRFEGLAAGDYSVTVRAPYGSPYADGKQAVTLYEGYTATNYSVVVTLELREDLGAARTAPATAPIDPDRDVPAEARKLWKQGLAARDNGQADRAVELLGKAIAVAPNYIAALNDLGVAYIKQGKLAAARPLFEHAAELAPEQYAPRMNLALVLLDLKEFARAGDAAERVLASWPASAPALLVTGEVALAEGRVADAIARLRRAADAEGETAGAAWYALGRAYEAAGQPDSAAEAYRAVIALEPGSARAAASAERLGAAEHAAPQNRSR